MTAELAYIIGLFVAEGSYSYGKLVIYNVDDDVINRLVDNDLGLNFVAEPQYQRISLCNQRFIEFLRALGFPARTTARTKMIPGRLMQLSKAGIIPLLSGLFDGDGHSTRHNGVVGFTTTSKVLRDQVRMLLLNLGILTKLSQDPRTERSFPKGYTSKLTGSWQLWLPTMDSQIFYDIIGFKIRRKQDKAEALAEPRLMAYGIKDSFRNLYRKYGCGCLGHDETRKLIRGKKCELKMLSRILNWCQHSDDKDYQAILARMDELTREKDRVRWLPIRSIKPSRCQLCEISVDSETHTYIANGIISHNSQIARTVILAYIKKEARDRKNSASYITHLGSKPRPTSDLMLRFLSEARDMCQFHDEYLSVLDALEWLIHNDDRPYDGIIGKLAERSGLSRPVVTNFMRFVKLRSLEFTDSPINRSQHERPKQDRRKANIDFDEE
jgi:hypothetical protein